MPISPGTFVNSKPLAAPRQRAYANVVITDPSGKRQSAPIQCLVDTGSDVTILPLFDAVSVGITPLSTVTLRTASGMSHSLPAHPAVDLLVETFPIQVPVLFSSAQGFIPILGRPDMVAAFDVGFDANNWYWG